ncbi:ATPase, partial [Pseudomonas syringae pv. syringae FF5]
MSNVLRPALSLIVLMSLITGVAYPLVVTGVAPV